MILGVSSHKKVCAKQSLTFNLLSDSNKEVVQQYGSLRNLVVLRIAARNMFLVGPDDKIVKIWTGVGPGSVQKCDCLPEVRFGRPSPILQFVVFQRIFAEIY